MYVFDGLFSDSVYKINSHGFDQLRTIIKKNTCTRGYRTRLNPRVCGLKANFLSHAHTQCKLNSPSRIVPPLLIHFNQSHPVMINQSYTTDLNASSNNSVLVSKWDWLTDSTAIWSSTVLRSNITTNGKTFHRYCPLANCGPKATCNLVKLSE